MESSSSDSLSTETLIRNATQKLIHSSSSLSTDALIHIATQPLTTLPLYTTPNTPLVFEPSTPEDISLSDDDQQVQKATKHLQQFSRLFSNPIPSSPSDSDDDFEMQIPPTPQSPHLPLVENPPALPSKLGK
jgi:hypothetical protein